MNRLVSASAERAVPCLNSNNCIETENLNKNNEKQIPIGYEKFLPNEMKTEFNEFSTSQKNHQPLWR